MSEHEESLRGTIEDAKARTASCPCGNLRVCVTGEPMAVYICGCQVCQRTTGSAFAYRAQFRTENGVTVEGEQRRWRRIGDSGRWVEHIFCPSCGALVFMESEGLRDAIAISAGCFADPAFPPPTSAYWTSAGPAWFLPPVGTRVVS